MLGWKTITPQDPSWGETIARHRRYQEYHSRKTNPIRTDRQMKASELTNIIKQATNRLMNVYSTYVQQAASIENNIMIYPQGRLQAVAQMREEAAKAVQDLQENIAVAADVAKKALAAERDKLRPSVDNATHERKARQLAYLIDRGVPLQDLIQENITDSVTLRILEDELPVLARGQEPQYKESGKTYDELLRQAARKVYGDQYRAADDKLAEVDRGAYRANVAAVTALRAIREDDRSGLAVPAYQDGQMIEV